MPRCQLHPDHDHVHSANCGHTAVVHEDHIDYLHDGHLHSLHNGHVDEHTIAASNSNPSVCTPEHACNSHDVTHVHGAGCGHEAVPHDDHIDYLVGGHLHHPHGSHCDNHGTIELV